MALTSEERHDLTHSTLTEINEALDSGTKGQVRRLLNGLRPVEIAHLIDSSPPPTRKLVWELIDKEAEAEVLQELSEDVQAQILSQMDTDAVVELTEGMVTDDLADILQQLPDRVTQEVLAAMSAQDRARVEQVLVYDEDTAGGIMDTDTITVRARLTLDVVLRYLRRHDELPDSTDNLIVVNSRDEFVGLLPLKRLLTSSPNTTVREIMITDVEPIPADMSETIVASLFEKHNWISAPVVDSEGKVVGRITIDDVVDVIIDQREHSLMSMAGLDEEEDTFANVMRTAPRRAMWLGINLLTALLASSVISMFEGTIDKVVALAVLMPIVASMGGVAGSQTLTVVIRGMALGQIGQSNVSWLLSREFRVGLLNGILWAATMAVIAGIWFQDPTISLIIAVAMVINLITAGVAGTMLPITMRAMNIDPALAGSVALTTVTDVVGFMSFLGLATYFYA